MPLLTFPAVSVRFIARLLAGAAGLVATAALACPVCAPSTTLSPAQMMINADRALLVRTEGPSGVLRIEAVIKGPGAPGEALDLIVPRPRTAAGEGKPLLLLHDELGRSWSVAGEADVAQAELLRSFTRLKRTSEMSPRDWEARVAQFLPLLEHPEPLVAATAYGEVARAPYAAMRANRAALDGARLARWTEDPTLHGRRPLYVLLLGLAGGASDAERIERQLVQRDASADRSDLPALVAADLELRGPSQLAWIEKQVLLNTRRSVSEVQAALVALSVHGNEGGRVPRERIIETYLRFVKARPPLGGLVAQDLAEWKVWDATPQFASALALDDAPIASRVAMVNYLRQSPHPQAKVAVERATAIR